MRKSFIRVLYLLGLIFCILQKNVTYAASISVAPTVSEVTITNNAGTSDTIYITGVIAGDKVTVYNAATDGKVVGKATVGSSKTDATIKISQLGTAAGSVYISVTSSGMAESSRTQINYAAEPVSDAPQADNISITNNSGKADTIYVGGLAPGDVIKIYNAATGGKLLGSATVGGNTTEVTKSIAQLGGSGGSVYISVTSKGMHESDRVEADFSAESQSDAPYSGNITITNNSGKSDTIYVSGLTPGDILKVYTSPTEQKLLGKATVGSLKTDATITVTQLGVNAGYVYISDTSVGMRESSRIPVYFAGENQSSAISTYNITITNNTGKSDTIYITGLAPSDKVKVYNAASGGSVLGSATVGASSSEATISISQLGTAAGTVYISVTSSGMLESSRVKVVYAAETQSASIDADSIVVTNNAGASDTVCVTGLAEGDAVNVYDSAAGGILLGTAVVATGSTEATVTISQLGTSAGTIYVSTKGTSKLESSRIAVSYSAEETTSTISADDVIVSNNSGSSDTVYVSKLNAGDFVKVYDSLSGGNLLGSATVSSGSADVTITITQLGTSAGSVYVSVTGTSKKESSRVQVNYSTEGESEPIDASNVVITNNSGKNDTVQILGLSSNDAVNVYNADKGGSLLGTGTVGQYDTSVTINISQLGTTAGSIYISRTSTNKLASSRTQATYSAEVQSSSLNIDNISVTNNAVGTADVVKVTGLSASDVVKVYDLAKGGTLLGSATVDSSSSSVTISIAQLGTSGGSVYVSVTNINKSESDRVKVDYSAEPTSGVPMADNIVVTNNAGIADTVKVTGLSSNDVVNVYDSASGGSLLGTATVASTGTETTVSIDQIGTAAGNIYVSVTSTGRLESSRTQVAFDAEAKSTVPSASKVTIVNNAGMAGTVKVAGLTGGDIVTVYDALSGGNKLGTATVGTYDTDATISVTQLGSDAGSVYITVKSAGKLESDRTKADYAAKTASAAPSTNYITVVNNAGIADTIKLTNLQPNDVVKIYDSADGGSEIGTTTVSSSGMTATISITQLSVGSGTIYVTITSTGKTESSRTAVAYSAERQSDAPDVNDITIANNSGSADNVDVYGLTSGDIITVYDAAEDGDILGTATVASGNSEAIVTISQLGTKAGSVYVSITKSGKTESDRTKADYASESIAPVAGNITIVNNAVIDDTVTVSGLTANDIVKVYDASKNGTLLGSAVVAANSTSATISISQLTSTAGSVYISVTNFGKGESSRTKADYISEQSSTPIYVGDVTIANNSYSGGKKDVITVNNLTPSSVVKVYDASIGGNLIGIATASSNGTQVTISIDQLSTSAGSVYLTVTVPGKNESSRTEADYIAEP